jgi:hypothetical protein
MQCAQTVTGKETRMRSLAERAAAVLVVRDVQGNVRFCERIQQQMEGALRPMGLREQLTMRAALVDAETEQRHDQLLAQLGAVSFYDNPTCV